jgi:hypothetical protein
MKHGKLNQLPEQPVSHGPEIKKQVLFKHGEIPFVTQFSQASFLPGQIAPTHSHDDMYGLQAERRCMPRRHDP